MAKKKRFLKEDYAAIKQLLSDNGIDTKKLNKYSAYKRLRYLRHRKMIIATDEELIEVVNYERDIKTLQHGNFYEEGCLDLPME